MADPRQQPIQAYIGLGSNLQNPRQQVSEALAELDDLPRSRVLLRSSLYRSDPIGPPGQPDYVNAVARLETALAPLELLDQLQSLEQHHQRKRLVRWGPRTLDLDLLLYGQSVIQCDRLTVPHPYLSERNFVLYPLQEIAPDLVLPDGRPLRALLPHCPLGTLERIGV